MSALVREPHPVAAPVSLAPFRATWLSPDRVGDPASARLLARPHRAVPERIRRWRKQGHLRQDDRPALYVHEFTSHGLTARALVALLDVTRAVDADAPMPGGAGVLPHEDVAPRQVTDLAERMDTMNLNPAPILLMHDATPGYRAAIAEACAEAPRHQFVDRAGQQHRIWRISAPDQQSLISREAAHDRLVVADGHHRLAAYQRLALRHAASGDDLDADTRPPWRDALVMLVDQGTTPLFLGAIHRVLRGVGMRAMLDAARRSEAGEVTSVEPGRAAHALGPRSIVFSDGHEAAALTLAAPDPRAAIEALHESVLPLLRKRPENLEYHHSADDALHRAARGPGTTRRTAILLPALSYERLVHVLDEGRRLPEKATSFQPKPSLGTVMRTW